MHDYLAGKGVKMWMWGDRLIDGESTGVGKWQASLNSPWPAIDSIPKDIPICDWHYRVAPPTAVMFAGKGFDVGSCSYQAPSMALTQPDEMVRAQSDTSASSIHMKGILHNFWGDTGEYMDAFDGKQASEKTMDAYKTFLALSEKW